MDKYRDRLEATLGIHDGSNRLGELSLDRESESGISIGSYSSNECVSLPPPSPATSVGQASGSFTSGVSSDADLKQVKYLFWKLLRGHTPNGNKPCLHPDERA